MPREACPSSLTDPQHRCCVDRIRELSFWPGANCNCNSTCGRALAEATPSTTFFFEDHWGPLAAQTLKRGLVLLDICKLRPGCCIRVATPRARIRATTHFLPQANVGQPGARSTRGWESNRFFSHNLLFTTQCYRPPHRTSSSLLLVVLLQQRSARLLLVVSVRTIVLSSPMSLVFGSPQQSHQSRGFGTSLQRKPTAALLPKPQPLISRSPHRRLFNFLLTGTGPCCAIHALAFQLLPYVAGPEGWQSVTLIQYLSLSIDAAAPHPASLHQLEIDSIFTALAFLTCCRPSPPH